MKSISSFFEKAKKIEPPDILVRERLVSIIFEEIGAEINVGDIKVNNFVAFISARPTVKSEIFLNKSRILGRLNDELGRKAPKDIK